MPEQQNVEGDAWLNKAIKILTELGWIQKGDKKVDITANDEEYGIDAFFTYYDPYEGQNIGVFVEAKLRSWNSVKSNLRNLLKDSINKMVNILENVPYSEEFNEKLNFDNTAKITNTGLIMLWVKVDEENKDNNYNHEKFIKCLSSIEPPKKRSFKKVFVASNMDIRRFCSIIDTSKELYKESDGTFRYYYPSLVTVNNKPERLRHLTLEYLYSKYIFGKMTNKDGKKVTVVFYMDDITFSALRLMENALVRYQLLDDTDIVQVYFYKSMESHREAIEEFRRTITDNLKGINVELKPMRRCPEDVLNYWG